MMIIGKYVLNTLQIFFPWDDALYTYLKSRGLGSVKGGRKALPLVYTDNCEVTVGKKELHKGGAFYALEDNFIGIETIEADTFKELVEKKAGLDFFSFF